MKALTLWQPWAGFVAAGMKRIETRSWPTEYRGEIAIHAAVMSGYDGGLQKQMDELVSRGKKHLLAATGAIIAVATLSDCVRTEEIAVDLSELELKLGNYDRGRWAWILACVRVLDNPVPCRGMQRIWNVPPEVEKRVYDEMPIPF